MMQYQFKKKIYGTTGAGAKDAEIRPAAVLPAQEEELVRCAGDKTQTHPKTTACHLCACARVRSEKRATQVAKDYNGARAQDLDPYAALDQWSNYR